MKTFAVTGATGAVGRVVARRLQSLGHEVRRVCRSAGVPIDDRAGLARSFSGADGVFVMVPFDTGAPDLHQREAEIAAKLADAVRAAAVPRVILLSGTSAHLGPQAGSGFGAAMMEERLDRLVIPELLHLRGCFFMENHLQGLPAIVGTGVYGWAFRPDRPTPMIAASDIGEEAAKLLTEQPFRQPRVRELLGPRDYTMAEAAGVLGTAIGMPDLEYRQLPYEDARAAMVRAGMSASFAEAVTQTARSFNDGQEWETGQRSAENTTATTLEQFAHRTFRPAYESALAGSKPRR